MINAYAEFYNMKKHKITSKMIETQKQLEVIKNISIKTFKKIFEI